VKRHQLPTTVALTTVDRVGSLVLSAECLAWSNSIVASVAPRLDEIHFVKMSLFERPLCGFAASLLVLCALLPSKSHSNNYTIRKTTIYLPQLTVYVKRAFMELVKNSMQHWHTYLSFAHSNV